MRVIYHQELQSVADALETMSELVAQAIHGAGKALIDGDMAAAQTVVEGDDAINALEAQLIDQCVRLLAQQSPVATDLRIVVSALRLAATFERMGDLAQHIAQTSLRTAPASPLPRDERTQQIFSSMRAFLDMTADRLTGMLAERDTDIADRVIADDNTLDQLHQETFDLALDETWQATRQQIIDEVLLARFMERLGDHAVSAARRVVYIVSGFDPSKEPKGEDD